MYNIRKILCVFENYLFYLYAYCIYRYRPSLMFLGGSRDDFGPRSVETRSRTETFLKGFLTK